MKNQKKLWATMEHEETNELKTAKGYLEFIQKELYTSSVATIASDGKLAIRAIDMMLYDNNVLYFLTARGRAFIASLWNRNF